MLASVQGIGTEIDIMSDPTVLKYAIILDPEYCSQRRSVVVDC